MLVLGVAGISNILELISAKTFAVSTCEESNADEPAFKVVLGQLARE